MKNYLLCLFMGLSLSLAAQTLPTQIQTYEWNSARFDWTLRSSDSYQYDERDSVRVTDSQSNWFGPSRFILSKDENGKVVESLSLFFDENDTWANNSRTRLVSEADGRDSYLIEHWLDDAWESQFYNHIRTTELADGIETDRETQTFENGVWTNQSRYYKKQNVEGVDVLQRHYEWKDNAWVENYRWINEFNDKGDLVYREYGNAANQDLTYIRRTYTYNASGQILTIREEASYDNSNIWIINAEMRYEYDSQGRETLYERKWNHQNRVRREERAYRGDTTIWSIFQSRNNSPLEGMSRRWSIEGPERYPQYIYWRIDNWENGAWVLSSAIRRSPSFDQHDNLSRLDQEHWVEGKWEDQLYQTHNWEYREDGEPIKMVSIEYNYITQRQTPLQKMIWRYEDRKKRSERPIIAIAPNPSTGPLVVNFHSAPVPPIRWELIDAAGRLVRAGDISEDEHKRGLDLFIDELQSGLYIFQIQYEDGSTVAKKWQKI